MQYHKLKASSEPGLYVMESEKVSEEDILTMAKQLAKSRFTKGRALVNPAAVRDQVQMLMQDHESEVFGMILMDCQLRVIGLHELFFGTLTATTIYPREVVKRVLAHNAAAVILVHNHPSGFLMPSPADLDITKRLKDVLAMIDVRVLDHFIVGKTGSYSLAEHGEV